MLFGKMCKDKQKLLKIINNQENHARKKRQQFFSWSNFNKKLIVAQLTSKALGKIGPKIKKGTRFTSAHPRKVEKVTKFKIINLLRYKYTL